MPPIIRGGKALKSRSRQLPLVQTWCRCSECALSTYCDPVLGSVVSGNKVTLKQWAEHRRRDQRKEAALHRIDELPAFSPIVEVKSSDGSDQEVQNPSPSFRVRKSKAKQRTAPSFAVDLESLRRQWTTYNAKLIENIIQENPLRFLIPPADQVAAGTKDLSLDPSANTNHAFIDRFAWLKKCIPDIELQLKRNGASLTAHDRLRATILINQLRVDLTKMQQVKEKEWDRQCKALAEHGAEKSEFVDTSKFLYPTHRALEPITRLCYILAAVLHLLCNISIMDSNLALHFLKSILQLSLHDSPNPEAEKIGQVPVDIRTVISSLDINPKYTTFVTCPRCFSTYKYANNPLLPELCSYTRTPGSEPCGTRLCEQRRTAIYPVRRYLYQDLFEWIGRMYSRRDTEQLLDTYPVDRPKSTRKMKDIWDGSMLRDFCGIDGKPFLQGPPGEGRLVFGINMDGFGVYNQKAGGKRNSVCGIYMVCFNLPPEHRFKTENMFLVGIVPGPTEPSVDQVNHVIRPLVDDLISLWTRGIFLSQTHKYPLGRLVRGAMLPVICDLPAARRISGIGSHSSKHFCSECYCTLSKINNLDRHNWVRRDQQAHRQQAERWKAAGSVYAQDNLFRLHGIRWSELLRLPYWDPTKHVVIDTMHAFYLRMYPRHTRDIWGMKADVEDGNGVTMTYDLTEEKMQRAQRALRYGSEDELKALSAKMLSYLCRDHSVDEESSPSAIDALLAYRVDCGWFTADGICLEPQAGLGEIDIAIANPPTDATAHPSNGRDGVLRAPSATEANPPNKSLDGAPAQEALTQETQLFRPTHETHFFQPPAPPAHQTQPFQPPASNESRVPALLRPMNSDIFLETVYAKENRSNALKKLSNAALLALCARVFEKPLSAFGQRPRKDALASQLLEARDNEERRPDFVPPVVLPQKSPVQTVVLGRNVLKAIRDDMMKISLPSSVSAAPKRPGEAISGTFKADEWKAFCNVNLPISLIRLWGYGPKDGRYYKMLSNYMDLVAATRIASLYSISEEEIDLMDSHLEKYLKGLRELYPASRITPYQHMSLHLADQIRRFGPTHSWRCYAFERYNGMIQKIPTNRKSGEMECTMFIRFIQTQRLRALFMDLTVPPQGQNLIDELQKRYLVNVRHDVLFKESTVTGVPKVVKQKQPQLCPPDLFAALGAFFQKVDPNMEYSIRPSIAEVTAIERFGALFNAKDPSGNLSPNNANIMYQLGNTTEWFAGIIQSIFSHERESAAKGVICQTFAIILPYTPLDSNDTEKDSFRAFSIGGGRLFYDTLGTRPILVPFQNIIGHIAVSRISIPVIEQPFVHVLPLNK